MMESYQIFVSTDNYLVIGKKKKEYTSNVKSESTRTKVKHRIKIFFDVKVILTVNLNLNKYFNNKHVNT